MNFPIKSNDIERQDSGHVHFGLKYSSSDLQTATDDSEDLSGSDGCQQDTCFLVSRTQKLLPWRDFHTEVRGIRDVQNLLKSCSVHLDVREMDLRQIIRRMLDEKPIASGKMNPIMHSAVYDQIFSVTQIEDFRAANFNHRLQSIYHTEREGLVEDQSWFTMYCSLDGIAESQVRFARLCAPTNFGNGLGEVRFITLVITPQQQKETKSALEIARTFSTLFADPNLHSQLVQAIFEVDFVAAIKRSAEAHLHFTRSASEKAIYKANQRNLISPWYPGRGLGQDLRRRLTHYMSDYVDGLRDSRAIHKTISTAVFLYFIVLPTAVSIGMLNEMSTHGKISVKKAILAQWLGGLFFGIFGGQLFLVILSSPPISIYIEVIEHLSHSTGYNFYHLYTSIGIWCSIYLAFFALLEAATIMKYARRSIEELFGMFIACTLTIEAVSATVRMLNLYDLPQCDKSSLNLTATHSPNITTPPHDPLACDRSVGLLFVLVMIGTVSTSVTLFNFRRTPFLSKAKRELLADYSLAIGVSIATLVVNIWFKDIPKETVEANASADSLVFSAFWHLPLSGHILGAALGFPLAVLFTMDQLLVTNTVDNSDNKLKKGAAANWDILVVAILNVPLSLFCLPWMHALLPQSFLHLRAQADVEDRLIDGTIQQIIVKNRESRLATLLAHGLVILTYYFLMPYLQLFPTSVYHGVFLYLAYTSTIGNELCQRVMLLFTEQRSYPPSHYNRRVPQRTVHTFTFIEVAQLIILLAIGHWPWPTIRLLFPIALLVFIPLRYYIFPRLFNPEHLEVLDGIH